MPAGGIFSSNPRHFLIFTPNQYITLSKIASSGK